MEESKRERVGGGKEVLSPSLPNPTLSPFFLAHFSLRFPNYLKACYRLTTCLPSFPTFYGIYSAWASSTFGTLLLISRNRFGSTNFSTAFRLWKCHFLSLPCLTDSPPPPPHSLLQARENDHLLCSRPFVRLFAPPYLHMWTVHRQRLPLFKAFHLQKYHVQDALNCITCLRMKASKTLPLSLSRDQIRLRALVCST